MANSNNHRGQVDPLADRNLVRISIAEILLLQFVVAALVWLGLLINPAPVVIWLAPFAFTLWGAFRLRNFPFLTWINPFTLAIAGNVLAMIVAIVVSVLHPPWRAWTGEPTIADAAALVLIGAPSFGFLQALSALVIVNAFTSKSPPRREP